MVTTQEVNAKAEEWGMPKVLAREGFKLTLKKTRESLWKVTGTGGREAREERIEDIKNKPFQWPKFQTGIEQWVNKTNIVAWVRLNLSGRQIALGTQGWFMAPHRLNWNSLSL